MLPLLWWKTHDLESVGNNADSHELLSVVAAVHHQRVGKTLDDGALGLPEALDGIATGGVRDIDGRADLNVIAAKNTMSAFCHICMVNRNVSSPNPRKSSSCVVRRLNSSLCRNPASLALHPCPGSVQGRKFAGGVSLRQRDIPDLNVLVAPAVEQLDAANLGDDLLGKDLVAGDGLDLDFAVVRHFGAVKMLTPKDSRGLLVWS